MEIKLKTLRMGISSVGVIFPKNIVEMHNLKPNENVIIDIKPRVLKVRDVFGNHAHWEKSPEQINKEIDEGWD